MVFKVLLNDNLGLLLAFLLLYFLYDFLKKSLKHGILLVHIIGATNNELATLFIN
jgi:hypothetical protein